MSELPHLGGRRFRIDHGDCLVKMRAYPDCCFDSIVTDPPYGLSFMGAAWDSFGSKSGGESVDERRSKMNEYLGANAAVPAFASSHGHTPKLSEMREFQESMTPIFKEALRVAKHGAYMLCFGGTRTFHRLACAIEDAGWEIRDTIMWVYGSGFPHGMDVSKAIDKALGAERGVVGVAGRSGSKRNCMAGDFKGGEYMETAAGSDEAAKWAGWNTALKPAWEPIIVARKPLDGTVAHNVMTHGVGAINVDACRIPTNDKLGGGMRANGAEGVWDRPFMHDEDAQAAFVERKRANVAKSESLGRFPANLVHDGSDEVLALFPDSRGQQGSVRGTEPSKPAKNAYGDFASRTAFPRRGDSGSAARFFYCAKASKADRGDGNLHPTVKPSALMQWLVRLVTPKGGVVLDPFAGSGSTGVAAMREGMDFVGMEMDESYCELCESRIGREI